MNNVKPEFISAAKNGDIPFLRSYFFDHGRHKTHYLSYHSITKK